MKSDYEPMSSWAAKEELEVECEKHRRFRNTVLCVGLTLLFIVCILVGKLAANNSDLKRDIRRLETQVADLGTTVAVRDEKIDKLNSELKIVKGNYADKIADEFELRSRLSALQESYNFYYDNAVFVTVAAGAKYHRCDCHYIDGRTYYIYNIELARAYGYTPCSYCFG